MKSDLAPINDGALAELWFALRNKTWRDVTKVVKSSGADQKQLAERIGMDPGQFNRIITGKAANVTLRTLHNIARAANHRLRISLEPLSDLPKPNYSYEHGRREHLNRIARETGAPAIGKWSAERGTGGVSRPLESVTQG